MDLLDPAYIVRVFLVFVRIGGLFVAAPFFSHGSVPVRVRVLLAVVLAYALSGLVTAPLPDIVTHPVGLAAAVAIEALTGAALGFAAQFIFLAVQYAGELLGFQMGLGLAQVFDPAEGDTNNPVGRILALAFLLIFLLVEGHHQVLTALVGSFHTLPLAGAQLSEAGPLFLEWTGMFITTALRLASPFMITIFLTDAALGVFARVAPQADLFSIALPLKLLVGLGVTYLVIEHFFPIVPGMIDGMVRDIAAVVEAMRP